MGLLIAISLLAAQPHVQPRTYPSTILGGERRVWVYNPPSGASARPAGLLICLWGQDYVGPIAAPDALDALIREGRVPPIAAIFLDQPDDRFQRFDTTPKVARSVAEELIPWARQTLGVTADAAHTIVAGYSAAGLGATYAAFARPDAFGNVLAQSGAFWRGFEGEGASDLQWLAARFAENPRRNTRFSLEVGGAETREAGGSGVSTLQANRRLRDVLRQKGYDLTHVEVPGAQHEYGHWKAAFGPALVVLTRDWK
jgi:enterochelin esterase family protein